jgi:glutamate/tyrosine decarboxylase-like PLP-dependent enzyme
MTWPALPPDDVARRVHAALDQNRSYRTGALLGLPGSFLDTEVFPATPDVVARPWLRTVAENPNHIGCHTLGESEPAFAGTQDLEREVVALCAEHLLRAEPGTVDGYVAAGGTESNIQALWAFRNAWRDAGISARRIGILCTADTHYSVHKGADLLGLPVAVAAVDRWTRAPTPAGLAAALDALQGEGVDQVAVVLTMGTTMFGTVEPVAPVKAALRARGLAFRILVDAAFGGFIYPLTRPELAPGFDDPDIHAITLDAHKMLQAPYGSGIHLARKGLLSHTTAKSATYVPGLDCTLSGSRGGANAVAVWMILRTWGHAGGRAFVQALADRAAWLVGELAALGIRAVHTPGMNVVTLPAAEVPDPIAARFMLVGDRHDRPCWRKIVVMEHVTGAALGAFLGALREARSGAA